MFKQTPYKKLYSFFSAACNNIQLALNVVGIGALDAAFNSCNIVKLDQYNKPDRRPTYMNCYGIYGYYGLNRDNHEYIEMERTYEVIENVNKINLNMANDLNDVISFLNIKILFANILYFYYNLAILF